MLRANLHHLESYDYHLPPERIAQYPVSPRDSSRLLFVPRNTKSFEDSYFRNLPEFLQQGDVVVLNNTRVIPARLQSDRGEVLLIRPVDLPPAPSFARSASIWDAMVFPGKHFKPGSKIQFEDGSQAQVLSHSPVGRLIRFESEMDALLRKHGKMPLPPYIDREANKRDEKTYQTIYARHTGSVAAPTAGLHFTRSVLSRLKQKGIETARLTLHVGPGTFRPVKDEDITKHRLYPEYYRCAKKTWQQIQNANRVIAVGTTVTRALETIGSTGEMEGFSGLFIYPGYSFKIIQGLLTNFHLPKSSLLMLVSAFGGYDLIRQAYRHAIDKEYRFYSYGDAMLIL